MTEDAGMDRSQVARILFMDDEEIVRDVVGRMLDILGFEYELAADGEAAVEHYNKGISTGSPFDLVILDWNVTIGIGGQDTFNRLRKIDPGVVAVASSGDGARLAAEGVVEKGFAGTIDKPYSMTDLKNCIDRVLGLPERI